MRFRRLITLTVVAVWLLLGPIAVAFDGCAAMGAMCEGPCGISSALQVPAVSTVPEVLSYLNGQPYEHLPTRSLVTLELPPRSVPRPV